MFVRFDRDYQFNPATRYFQNDVRDLPRDRAQKLIDEGAATLVTSDPGMYRPDAVAILGGAINNTTVGATTRSTVAATTLSVTGADNSGTPGNTTLNAGAGKAAIAAAATTCVVTNSQVVAADRVFCQLEAADATATAIKRVTPAAGSFTIEVNAAATAATKFSFFVVKA